MRIDVITVSTSRYEKFGEIYSPKEGDDISGDVICQKVAKAGHVYVYKLISDGIEPLRSEVMNNLKDGADVVVICGGTGLAPRDLSIEAIEPLYDKGIRGFGEIFRIKSLDQVGTRAMLTRASAGIIKGAPVFCLPGSPAAAELGIDLILAEIDHIIKHINE